jgi:hypothetical protein
MQTTIETAMKASMRDARVRHAVDRLLYRLREWARAYPRKQNDTMPDHDIVFATGIDGGPEQEIGEAMKATPALWVSAIPDDVVMVCKSRLTAYGVEPALIEWWQVEVANMIESESQRRLWEEQNNRQR